MSPEPPFLKKYSSSLALYKQSKKYLVPGGATISKRPDLYPFGAYPIYITKCLGSKVQDIDGNIYSDFQSSLGAVLLGYNHKSVNLAIREQLKKGNLFPLSNPDTVELAKKLCSLIPCAKKIRILKNGSDATTGAVKIARAYTNRNKILTCHYHGWHDWFYVSTNMNKGIPSVLKNDVIPFQYNNLKELEYLFNTHKNEIAAVMMEPANLEAPHSGYLDSVKKITHKNGAVLIFDEVVTGFRYDLKGAQNYFKVVPDLACFAKALGNGAPIAAIVGGAKIMDQTEDVVTTQTYAEDCLAIAASLATIKILSSEPVVEHVWELGRYFKENFAAIASKHKIPAECVGFPPRMQINFSTYRGLSSKKLKTFLLQETAKDNILIGHMIFINYSHTKKDVTNLLKSIDRIFSAIAKQKIKLHGQVIKELW